MYPITCPSGRVISGPPEGRYWVISEPKFREWDKDKRIWWGKDGSSVPQVKKFLAEVKQGRVPQTLWFYSDVGHTDESKKEVKQIVGFETREEGTITPKPSRLIQRILEIATDKNSLILDSFAGSGTTAHAVLALNAKDGGNRKFILCETEDYADTLTAERVRRVINGYGYTGTQETELHPPEKLTWTSFAKDNARNKILDHIQSIENLERVNYDKIEKKIIDGVLTVVGQRQVKQKMPGLGGSFTYVELGEAMDLERLLAETPGTLPSFPALARYLFFTATGHTLPAASSPGAQPSDAPVLIGETAVWRIYLHYRPDEAWLRSPAAAFTRTQAEAIAAASKPAGKQALVFAAAKFINHRSLRELRVDFAQLPYALHRVQAE
ncbi:MAG: DNA methyltransferase [Burkholderiales bacterium]